jgi:porphobilinogen deaminase
VPVYGHAWFENQSIHLKAGVLSLEGDQHLECKQNNENPIALGISVAEVLINAGANELLQKIKANL